MERTIEISGVDDELLCRLDQLASQIGVDRNSYVRSLLQRAVAPPESAATLGELPTSVHDYTEARAIPEKEIEQFLREHISEARRDRRRGRFG